MMRMTAAAVHTHGLTAMTIGEVAARVMTTTIGVPVDAMRTTVEAGMATGKVMQRRRVVVGTSEALRALTGVRTTTTTVRAHAAMTTTVGAEVAAAGLAIPKVTPKPLGAGGRSAVRISPAAAMTMMMTGGAHALAMTKVMAGGLATRVAMRKPRGEDGMNADRPPAHAAATTMMMMSGGVHALGMTRVMADGSGIPEVIQRQPAAVGKTGTANRIPLGGASRRPLLDRLRKTARS